MRIISGFLKGKSIDFIKNLNTRPLKDSVKENIFNILKHSNLFDVAIDKAIVLDLYSGIGSFGIESISRGAQKVTFVEQDKNAVTILKKNLDKLSILNNVNILNQTVEDFLKSSFKQRFNIFFLDPPFSDQSFVQNLDIIKKNKIFEENHIIIIHRARKALEKLENVIDVIEAKHYGRSKIIFGFFN